MSTTENSWKVRDVNNDAYSGEMVWQYAKEFGYSKDDPTTASGSDDSLITQDTFDRDGEGDRFQTDLNVDLLELLSSRYLVLLSSGTLPQEID